MATNGDYATKGDLKEFRTELKGDMASLRDELVEAIHDSETKLLKAFYDYAESNRCRTTTAKTPTTTLAKRVEIVEGKLLAIEKKLDLPDAS
jgi:hypothetical protein